MAKRFTFNIGGHIEVVAENAEEARKMLTSQHGSPRAFIQVEGGVFVYAVPTNQTSEVDA